MNSVESSQAADPAGAEASNPSGSFAPLLTGLLVFFACFLVWREFEPIVLFRRVDGVVVGSEVEKTYVFLRRGRNPHYSAQITYRYQVNGERFLGLQYRRTNILGSRSEASRLAHRYVVGARVPAWYNPLNPAECVLSRAPDPMLFAMLGIVGIGVWRFWQALHGGAIRAHNARVSELSGHAK